MSERTGLVTMGGKPATLLGDEPLMQRMGQRSRQLVVPYTYRNAAFGLASAIRHAAKRAVGEQA